MMTAYPIDDDNEPVEIADEADSQEPIIADAEEDESGEEGDEDSDEGEDEDEDEDDTSESESGVEA